MKTDHRDRYSSDVEAVLEREADRQEDPDYVQCGHCEQWLHKKGIGKHRKAHKRSEEEERHGTYAGHQRHMTLGEKACDPCIEARRRYRGKTRNVDGGVPCPQCTRVLTSEHGLKIHLGHVHSDEEDGETE